MQLQIFWSNLKLCYNRFTLSRIAKVYFALALLHCIAQIVLQIRGLRIERSESFRLHHVMNVGDVVDRFAILDSSDAILICHAIPGRTSDPHPCEKFPVDASGLASTSLNATGDTCDQVLSWPAQIVHQAIRESIAMTVFQTWLIGISIIAIITESIPHVVAAFVTQLLSTVWSLFHIGSTKRLHRLYNTLVTDLACNHVDPMPNYWDSELNNEIPILALNAAFLLVCALLSWKLCKQFGVQSFTRVGGCKRIHHLYLLVLVLFVCLQLATFFLITSLILWIEQLFNGPIATLANKQTVYLSVFISTTVLIIPWRYMGWTAVRRERRRMMTIFLFTSGFLTVSQMGMFLSPIYRLTFSTWNFFGAITVIAYVLLNMSFFMALVCRYFFGRGLAHFLQVQKALSECDFTPVYIERGSLMFESTSTKDPGAAPMPWDVEGRSVVKKLSLPRLDQCHDSSTSIPSAPGSVQSSAFVRSPAYSQSSFPTSGCHDTDSHDSTVILDAAAVVNTSRGSVSIKPTSVKSTSAMDRSGTALPDLTCPRATIYPEDVCDSVRAEDDTAHPIHRGISFSTASSAKQPLVLPSSVKQNLRSPPNLTIVTPRGSDHQ